MQAEDVTVHVATGFPFAGTVTQQIGASLGQGGAEEPGGASQDNPSVGQATSAPQSTPASTSWYGLLSRSWKSAHRVTSSVAATASRSVQVRGAGKPGLFKTCS